MPLRFKLLGSPSDIINVKLKPSLWRRKFVGPGILAKAGLCCLRKRPQSESLCAFQCLGVKITPSSSLNLIPRIWLYSLRLAPVSRTIGPKPAMNNTLMFPIWNVISCSHNGPGLRYQGHAGPAEACRIHLDVSRA